MSNVEPGYYRCNACGDKIKVAHHISIVNHTTWCPDTNDPRDVHPGVYGDEDE